MIHTGRAHALARCKLASRASSQSRIQHIVRSNSNGNGASTSAACPSAAETARTVVDLCNEGTLSTRMPDGAPMGTAVAYRLDVDGFPIMQLAPGSLEAANLGAEARCSLLVQPITWPARRVGSVALSGSAKAVAPAEGEEEGGLLSYKLEVDSCCFTGGLSQVHALTVVYGVVHG